MDLFNFSTAGSLASTEVASGDKVLVRDVSVSEESSPGGLKWATIDNIRLASQILGSGAAVEARTATAAPGGTTGVISAGTTHVTVTSDDANKVITLPTPVVGTIIVLHNGATGYELRSDTPASVAINAGTGANAESAIPANSTCVMICVTTTAWKGFFLDADSDVAKVEAAA